MKIPGKFILKVAGTLTVISLVVAALLGFVNSITADKIAEIDAEFRKMLDRVSTETVEAFDEETATRLMNEKSRLQQQLGSIADAEQRRENAKSRLDDIYMILDGIKNRPMEYDDQIVRQLLERIVVDSKEQVTVIFKGGLKSVQPLTE